MLIETLRLVRAHRSELTYQEGGYKIVRGLYGTLPECNADIKRCIENSIPHAKKFAEKHGAVYEPVTPTPIQHEDLIPEMFQLAEDTGMKLTYAGYYFNGEELNLNEKYWYVQGGDPLNVPAAIDLLKQIKACS